MHEASQQLAIRSGSSKAAGRLGADPPIVIEAHLVGCPVCLAAVERRMRLDSVLGRMLHPLRGI